MSIKNRNCIICNINHYDEIFKFSNTFLDAFQNNSSRQLELNNKYGPHIIVKCKNCGCKYVPNVIEDVSQNSNTINLFESKNRNIQIKEQNKEYYNREINKFKDPIYKLKLLKLISKKNFKDLSILDYGSGGGRVCKLSELFGFNKIVAYDPVYNEGAKESFEIANFKKINVINNIDKLSKHEKFDIIWCSSVIEHAFSPKDVFRDLKKLSNLNSVIFMGNPVMDIEKDLDDLLNLNKGKKNRHLHYHLGHINYMLGKDFNKPVKMYGFKILPIYPLDTNFNIMNLIKKIIVKIFPKITRSEYILKKT